MITGAGRFFCAGGDLRAMAASSSTRGQYVKAMADDLHRALSTFARMDAVVITAVNGVAAGAGFSLAVAGDLVLAAESATFTMAYTAAGLCPDEQFDVLPTPADRRAQNTGTDVDQPDLVGRKGVAVGTRDRGGRRCRATRSDGYVDETDRLRCKATRVSSQEVAVDVVLTGSRNRWSWRAGSSPNAPTPPTAKEGIEHFVEKRRPDFD